MALVTCTNCGAKLNTKNPMAPGKKVGCPKCKTVFVVQDEPPAAAEEVVTEAPPSGSEKATSPARHDDGSIKEGTAPPLIVPTKPAARDDDDRDDPDEPPRKKHRDEDDGDDEPAQKRALAKDLPKSRTPYLAIAGVVALGILCSVLTVAVCVISMERDRVPRHQFIGPNRLDGPMGGRKNVGGNEGGDGQPLPGMVAMDAVAKAQAREDAKKREQDWLQAIRKLPRPDEPGVLAVFDDPGGRTVRAAFSPAEPLLAIATPDSPKDGIKLIDLRTLKVAKTIPATFPIIEAVTFSPDGKLLVIATRSDKTIRSWNVADGNEGLKIKFTAEPHAIAFTADGSHLLVNLDGARAVSMYKLPDGNETPFDEAKDAFRTYILMPGADRILVDDRSDIQKERLIVHDVATGKRKYLNTPKTLIAFGGAASPDGRWYVWESSDLANSHLRLFDVDNDQTATVASAERFALGTSPVFTPDSKYLVYHVKDKQERLRFIHLADKTEYASVPGPWSLNAFSPGGVFWIRQMGGTVFLHAWDDLKK